MLLENSAYDNKNNFFKKQIFFLNKLTLYYIYYFFTFKSKIILLQPLESKFGVFKSIDKIFKSAGWLERETGEMFKVSFSSKVDIRRLLLDYSKKENPLTKEYPVEGFNDVFYSFFDDQVIYNTSTNVEL